MKVSSKGAEGRALPRAPYLVKQLERVLRARVDAIVQPFGVTAVQYTALSVVARNEGMSSAQLARRSFISAQAANELVAALIHQRLIRRRGDDDGGRALGIYLTAQGERLLARCDDRMDALESEMFRGMNAREVGVFREALRTCCDALRQPSVPRRASGTAG
jgi:DNA-binding MarR family transcriptional regulator